jgi:hypothetical protein
LENASGSATERHTRFGVETFLVTTATAKRWKRRQDINVLIVIAILVVAVVAKGQDCSGALIVEEQDSRVSAGSREGLRATIKEGIPSGLAGPSTRP